MDRDGPHACRLQKLARLARVGGGVALGRLAPDDRQPRLAEKQENLPLALGFRSACIGYDGNLRRRNLLLGVQFGLGFGELMVGTAFLNREVLRRHQLRLAALEVGELPTGGRAPAVPVGGEKGDRNDHREEKLVFCPYLSHGSARI